MPFLSTGMFPSLSCSLSFFSFFSPAFFVQSPFVFESTQARTSTLLPSSPGETSGCNSPSLPFLFRFMFRVALCSFLLMVSSRLRLFGSLLHSRGLFGVSPSSPSPPPSYFVLFFRQSMATFYTHLAGSLRNDLLPLGSP